MKKMVFWGAAAAACVALIVVGLNLFDAPPAPQPTAPLLPGAGLGPDNGFFILWGFAEPPASDPSGQAYRGLLLDMFAARARERRSRSPYGQWLARLNLEYREHWQGARLNFPQATQEDICVFFAKRRTEIAERRQRFAVLQKRYEQVLGSSRLEDFSPVGFELPKLCANLAAGQARLFAASRLLAALDGDWLPAGADLLAAAAAGFRLISSGRTLAANSLGKDMVELSLRALVALLNRPECPSDLARLVLERLPARTAGRFGTATVRAFTCLDFAADLSRLKKSRIVDPWLLKDFFREPAAFFAMERFVAISGLRLYTAAHALAAFFVQENETLTAACAFWENVGRLEEIPPWQWDAKHGAALHYGLDSLQSPFWWLRNPLGKMMVRSAVPYTWPVLQHYVYRSHVLKARYDLVRLLARARLQAGRDSGLSRAELAGLLSSAAERDPFSGLPFLLSRERGVLYSIGPNGSDDGGREQPALWRDSDIAVPIRFVISNE
ncbi:MAG TPA: hypothetical protein VMZ49_08845 [Patescibacteria group bacterium]|nr:hypothetical protein [Patescibacteria group bacterium]